MKFGKFFAPMLLKEINKPFDSQEYLFEIKFDGIRATMHVGPSTFLIFNRNGKEISNLYPELKSIQTKCKENIIFDGEIVIFDNNRPSFAKLQERTHLKSKEKMAYFQKKYPVTFVAFDCLFKNKDLTAKTLMQRKKILNEFSENDNFFISPYILEKGKKLFQTIQEQDLEGIVAKKINSKYEINNRSENWLKIKNFKEGIFFIGAWKEEKRNAVVSLYLGEYHNNRLFFVGKVAMGKKRSLYSKLLKAKIRKTSPFINYQEENIHYINPKFSCIISYIERTKTNHLRQPIFKTEKE